MRHHNRASQHLFGEISRALQLIIRNEVQLMKAEIQESGGRVARDARMALIFGALAIFGLLPFMAFLVVGLGKLIGDNYWLSSLIIAVLCIGVGGAIAVSAIKRIGNEDLTLPRTRRSMNDAYQRTRAAMEGVQVPFGMVGREPVQRPSVGAPVEEITPPAAVETSQTEKERRAA